ncbi:MAG: hypothetical protein LC620_01255 [Halobacteriales archaeon]|nr:hypothetical protein [Halobacteriales archaeon]
MSEPNEEPSKESGCVLRCPFCRAGAEMLLQTGNCKTCSQCGTSVGGC